jgi:hypothetical protein
MPLRVGALVLLASAVALVGGAAAPSTAAPTVSVFFVHGEQLGSTERIGATLGEAVRALLAGPTRADRRSGMRTYIAAGTARVLGAL